MAEVTQGQPTFARSRNLRRFFIHHSAFDILHFGFRGCRKTEMSNEE